MKFKVYRPVILVLAIVFLLFAAAIAFEASTDGLSRGLTRSGGGGMGRFFVTMKTLFGEFVARYFVSLPFALVGISCLVGAFRPKVMPESNAHNVS